MSEVDAMSGKCSQDYMALIKMMAQLGYDHQFFEKKNLLSGSGIWYKKDKFNMLETHAHPFGPGSSQFMMTCKFSLKTNDSAKFVVGQTHLKAKPAFIKDRVA